MLYGAIDRIACNQADDLSCFIDDGEALMSGLQHAPCHICNRVGRADRTHAERHDVSYFDAWSYVLRKQVTEFLQRLLGGPPFDQCRRGPIMASAAEVFRHLGDIEIVCSTARDKLHIFTQLDKDEQRAGFYEFP